MKGDGVRVVVGAALCGFALAYALPVYAHLPNAFYDPQHRVWRFGASPGPIAMGYYGLIAWGVVGALAGAGGGALLARRSDAGSLAGLFAAWSLAALVVVGAWFAWNNWP